MKVGDIDLPTQLEVGYIYNFTPPSNSPFKVTKIVNDAIFLAYHDSDYLKEEGLIFKNATYKLVVEYAPTELEKDLL